MRRYRFLITYLFYILTLSSILYACGDVGGSGQCGGVGSSGTCVRIDKIEPTYLGTTTYDVDTTQDICVPDNPATPANELIIEPFTDHNAKVTISNTALPGMPAEINPIVTLQDYSVSYSVNVCPAGAKCPSLDTIPVAPGQTTSINKNSSADLTLDLMPLMKKFEFIIKGGTTSDYPSYTANYTIAGTDMYKNKISVKGYAEFTIGNFDNCP